MDKSQAMLEYMGLPTGDELIPSEKRFKDEGQYRIEIPSTEGPEPFRAILKEKEKLKLPIHRISQGSGIQMLSDEEIKEMARMGAENNIEVCLFTTLRANFGMHLQEKRFNGNAGVWINCVIL